MKSLKEYRYNYNPTEQVYVEYFISLLKKSNSKTREYFEPFLCNERLLSIVISTVHWFATPVGSSFVKDYYESKETDVVKYFKYYHKYSGSSYIDLCVFGCANNNTPTDFIKNDKEKELFYYILKWLDTTQAKEINSKYEHKL